MIFFNLIKISGILREGETDEEHFNPDPEEESKIPILCSPVKGFDKNVLPSNNPIEDAEAECVYRTASGGQGMMFGVFDGHGGHACAQVR